MSLESLRSASTSPVQDTVTLPPVRDIVTLQVGDRRFTTTKETLTDQCGFFSSLLSGRWNDVQPDGSYFIDADGDLFEHILRYLRRGVLPVFYDNSKGHDHALYLALLEEARYFQIPRLEEWLEDKTYLQAIKIMHTVVDAGDAESLGPEPVRTDMTLEYHPTRTTKKVYVCPRGILVHRGDSSRCGRQCMNAKGDSDDQYEDEQVLEVVVIRKQIVFDRQICIEGR
jgi:BTB/POZ domain-containing protein KCTD9